MLVAVLAGIFTWSLLEYLIHRFAGHARSLVKRTPFGREHTAHHSRGDYFAPWWKKLVSTVVFIALVLPLARLATSWPIALAYTGGLIGFYLTYEVLHRLLHVWQGVGPYARWARRHHFHHHFHDPQTNHGVTSPVWDIVFGTWRRPAQIQVPAKLAMRWLRDPTTGTVHAHLARDYALRTR